MYQCPHCGRFLSAVQAIVQGDRFAIDNGEAVIREVIGQCSRCGRVAVTSWDYEELLPVQPRRHGLGRGSSQRDGTMSTWTRHPTLARFREDPVTPIPQP